MPAKDKADRPAQPDLINRIGRSPAFWLILLVLGLGIPFGVRYLRSQPAAAPGKLDPYANKLPPFFFQLPTFSLVDQGGRPFGSAQLKGKVWIANFIFTSCPSICPKLSAQMAGIQRRVRSWGPALHLVSFSVDPQNDTPAKLAAYASKYGADHRQWSFLTGALGDVEKAVRKGFKLAMDRRKLRPDGRGGDRELFDITHGTRFVLVDRGGGIRGFYESTSEGIAKLLRHGKNLLESESG